MVCKEVCEYYLHGIKIKKPLITDLALHYGHSFVPTHEKIMKSLNKKESKGIVLLHGIPGSGKYYPKNIFGYLSFSLLNRKNTLHSIFDPRNSRQNIDLCSTRHGKRDRITCLSSFFDATSRRDSYYRRCRKYRQRSR